MVWSYHHSQLSSNVTSSRSLVCSSQQEPIFSSQKAAPTPLWLSALPLLEHKHLHVLPLPSCPSWRGILTHVYVLPSTQPRAWTMGDLTFADRCVLTGIPAPHPWKHVWRTYCGHLPLTPSFLQPFPFHQTKMVPSSPSTSPAVQSLWSLPSLPQPLLTTLPSEIPRLPYVLHLGPQCILSCTAVVTQGIVAMSSDWVCDLRKLT